MDIIRTGLLPDKKIILLLEEIEKTFGLRKSYVYINKIPVDYKLEENKKLLSANDSRAITSASIITTDNKFTIQYNRGIVRNNVRESSPYFDEITITPGTSDPGRIQPTVEDAISCHRLIQKYVVNVLPASTDKEASDATNLLQAQISSLSSQYQDMINGIDQRRAELDRRHYEKIESLEKEYQQKKEDLAAHEMKTKAKLDAEADALEQRRKTLDDRDHRHVQRDLRANINGEIKARLTRTLVSKQASFLRIMIFFISISGAISLGYLSFSGFHEFSLIAETMRNKVSFDENITNQTSGSVMYDAVIWGLLIKSIISSIGALGFLVYALTWLRKIYHDDVHMQSELEKYAYDINRASWAIETIMDHEKGGSLPPETWIEAVCNNLFMKIDRDKEHKNVTPLELLLSASARAEFGPEGPKFEINRHGAKKLVKQIANDGV